MVENKRLPDITFFHDLLTVLPSNDAIVWNPLGLKAIGIRLENHGQVPTLCRLLTKDRESRGTAAKESKKKPKP